MKKIVLDIIKGALMLPLFAAWMLIVPFLCFLFANPVHGFSTLIYLIGRAIGAY